MRLACRQALALFSVMMLRDLEPLSWVLRTNFVEIPMPDVIKESPNDVRVSLDCLLLGP